MSFTVVGLLVGSSVGAWLGIAAGIVTLLGFYYYKGQHCEKEAKSVEDKAIQYLELKDNFKELANNKLKKHSLSYDECVNEYKKLQNSTPIEYVKDLLYSGLLALSEGKFQEASEKFKLAHDAIGIALKAIDFSEFEASSPKWAWDDKEVWQVVSINEVLSFAARACDALYLGDVEKMRELLNEAREMLDERDKFVVGDVKFFKYLFEFHYFLLKAVVEAHEAEMGAVAKATQEQAERFAAAKPVEVPETVEKVTVSAEEPERELYRGEVRFKMGAMSQERVGTLVITNKRLKLTGKYRLRGYVATVAIKAALRAAGIGEVYEDIPLSEIKFLQLKKALLGGYYLEFKARGKKYTLYTDAAQHIYNLLKQYGAETV